MVCANKYDNGFYKWFDNRTYILVIEWLKINDYGEKQKKNINRSIIKQKEELKKYMIFLGGNMTEKRFTVPIKYRFSHSKIQLNGDPLTNDELVRILNTNDGAFVENFALKEENEQLRKDATTLIYANQDYKYENEHLREQLDDANELNKIYVDFMVDNGFELSDVVEWSKKDI